MASDILIVDDEPDIRKLIRGILEDEGFAVREAGSAKEAYSAVEDVIPALVVQDIWLQGSADDGLDILKKLKKQNPDLPFVMISGHGTIETAVSAIKDGAYDFIEKPFKSDRLIMMVRRAIENAALKRENAALRMRASAQVDELLGDSQTMQQVRQVIERAAPSSSRILITGEAGVGKDVAARQIHNESNRKDAPYVVLNCATLRPERLEIELFGIEAGVQKGEAEHVGVLEQARGGTLLLDEVADMPLETQNKIIRALQEEAFSKIGSQNTIPMDVRVLATTNKDLKKEIEQGRFREDLYYRLNVVEVHIPALSQRSEDVTVLAQHFLSELRHAENAKGTEFGPTALKMLKGYKWPGNVRQLKNVIEWLHIMHGNAIDKKVSAEHLPPEITGMKASADSSSGSGVQDSLMEMPLRDAREAFERDYLLSQVERFDGNISKTAQFVGMERSALHRKLKSLEIKGDKAQDESGADSKDKVVKIKRA